MASLADENILSNVIQSLLTHDNMSSIITNINSDIHANPTRNNSSSSVRSVLGLEGKDLTSLGIGATSVVAGVTGSLVTGGPVVALIIGLLAITGGVSAIIYHNKDIIVNYIYGHTKKEKKEKASKLYETYLEISIIKNFKVDTENINDLFKKKQIYKRLAKKFVLTQTGYMIYNENKIFDTKIEILSDILFDIDNQIKIKNKINTMSSLDPKFMEKKITNYLGFKQILKNIENFKINMVSLNSDKSPETDNNTFEEILNMKKKEIYEKYINNTALDDELIRELNELIDAYNNQEPNTNIVNKNKTNLKELDKKYGIELFKKVTEAETMCYEKLKKDNGVDAETTEHIGGTASFNIENRSKTNSKFTIKNIDNFMKYFKIITYDLNLKIKETLQENLHSESILESFIDKYLNILLRKKINDDGLTYDDGIIEEHKKGIINPKFLKEKIGSIASYISLSNIIVFNILEDVLKGVLEKKTTLGSDKSDGGEGGGVGDEKTVAEEGEAPPSDPHTSGLKVIIFELIKKDLIDILIETLTNISTIKVDIMQPDFVKKLREKFQRKFDNKLGLTQQEKELSKETQEQLNNIFEPQFSDTKTIQNYKKQIRTIDDIIENKATTGSLDFVNVFTAINDKEIFNTKFDLNTDGITIKLGDDVDLQYAKEKQDSFEKDQILKLLTERAFSKSSIEIINAALDANAKKRKKVEEEPISRAIQD